MNAVKNLMAEKTDKKSTGNEMGFQDKRFKTYERTEGNGG